jgi:ABC-type Na+ efflux pump permease subunit
MSDRGWFSDVRIAVAKRDISSLSREKTIVLALLIQLFIAAFSSFLVVGLTSLYDPGSVESDDVTIALSGDASSELVRAADDAGINAEVYPTQEAAREAFQNGGVDAAVHADYLNAKISATATIPEGSVRSTLLVVQTRQLLEELERNERFDRRADLSTQPVPLPEEGSGGSPYFGFTYTILVPLLLFLPPFISGSVTVDSLTEEMERGTLELLRVAPVSLVDIVDGKALGMAALAPAQALLWILLLSANGIAISNIVPLLVLVSAISLVVVVLGATLGLAMGTRRQAQLLYSVLALALFGLAALLPEHPAAAVAKLAVDSATTTTYATVVGLAVGAAVLYALTRRYVAGIDPERY